MIGHALDIGIGTLELLLAGYVLRRLWRFRRGFPWLIAPTAFFLLRGVDRFGSTFFGGLPHAVGLLVDPLVLTLLVLLLFSVDRIVRSLTAAENAAELREREYARALLDYRRLARHRLATPVTAIVGGARYLIELAPEDKKLRTELVEMIEDAAARLERVSLDPRSDLEADERSLRPAPSLDGDLLPLRR
jgi:signal transduction histidine kinase